MSIFTRTGALVTAAVVAGSVLVGCSSTPPSGSSAAAMSSAAGSAAVAPTTAMTIPTPATTPVRATITGPTTAYVPSAQPTLSVLSLSAAASIGGKVSAKITGIEKVQETARVPGEVSGAALAVHVELSNQSTASIDLNGVVVQLQDHAGTPASPVSSSPENKFAGPLAAKKTASAIYVFTLPSSNYNPITIGVSYSNAAPLARFVGDAN